MKQLFPSLPENAGLAEVFQTFPDTVKPLLAYHDVLLRGESPLTIAQRELIAAYVSGLNACNFCFGAHVLMAAFMVSRLRPSTLSWKTPTPHRSSPP